MKSRPRLSVLIALLTVLAVWSCTGDGCFDNATSVPLAAFYQGGKAVSIDSLTVRGVDAPGDSLLIAGKTVQQVYLPLRVKESSCRFVFMYKKGIIPSDTIGIDYEAVPTFVSRECGAMYFFRVKGCSTTHNAIDSISIPDGIINNQDKVSIKIFMRQ